MKSGVILTFGVMMLLFFALLLTQSALVLPFLIVAVCAWAEMAVPSERPITRPHDLEDPDYADTYAALRKIRNEADPQISNQ